MQEFLSFGDWGEISLENSVEALFFLLFFPPGRSLNPILSPPLLLLPVLGKYKQRPDRLIYSFNTGSSWDYIGAGDRQDNRLWGKKMVGSAVGSNEGCRNGDGTLESKKPGRTAAGR